MFDSLALTISDYLRIGMSDAYLLIFAFFLAIGVKFWLGIEKLNSFYFGLVTGILIYFTLIGIANIPVDPTVMGWLPNDSTSWISRCAYIVLFVFPIGSVVKWFGSKERASHPTAALIEDILTYILTWVLLLFLFVSLSEGLFIWWDSPLSGVFTNYSWYQETLKTSQAYMLMISYTRELLLIVLAFWLYREFLRPLVTLLIFTFLLSLHGSVTSLSQSLSQRLGKWDDSHGDGGHSEHGWDHGHDDHGGWHGDIVVDHGHGWGGHH